MASNKYSDREQRVNALFVDLLQNIKQAKLLNPDTFSEVVREADFLDPEDLKIHLGNLADCLEAEKNCAFQPRFRTVSYGTELRLRELGMPPEGEARNARIDPRVQAMSRMAHTLLASPEGALRIRVGSTQSTDGTVDTSFCVAAENLSDSVLLGMLRSCYGQVSGEVVEKTWKKYNHNCYATASMLLRSKQEIKKDTDEKEHDSWVTLLLRSLACSCNYSVEVQLVPVEDEGEVQELAAHLEELQNLHSKMAFLSEISWSQGYAVGESVNSKRGIQDKVNVPKNIGKAVDDAWYGSSQIGMNLNANYGLSSKKTHKQLQCLMEDLDYEIQRLQDALNGRAWKVIVKASADEERTLDAITAAFAGVMEKANIGISWSRKPVVAFVGASKAVRPLLALPTEDYIGFRFVENERFSLMPPTGDEGGLWFGNILWNGAQVSQFRIHPNLLNRHAFICGMTGSGKTNTLFRLLEGMNVPFMAIEPVKGEYRSLRGHYPDLHIWTTRTSDKVDETVKLLRINPFWFPAGGNLSFHIDSLKTLIASAFELSAAMPNILEQCLYNVYVHAGWNIVTNSNVYAGTLPEAYRYPTFEDLANEVEVYLDNSDFGEEVLGNYKGALLSRLRSFTNGVKGVLLNTACHPDYGSFLLGRNVIELEGLADDGDKCLIMGTILVQYYQYLKLHFTDTTKNTLSHIIVMEEAHRLFKNQRTEKSAEGPNPTGQLVETLSNIMAEIRAFGEGMLIVDQSPTKIAEDVIKNSATKIVHRIDNEKDIKILRSAMLISGNGYCFPSLTQGEAIIRTDGMVRSAKVKVLKSQLKEDYSMSSSFESGAAVDENVYIEYTAAAILRNSTVYEALSELVKQLIASFAFLDWQHWHALTERFVIEVYRVLEENGCVDMLSGKFGILEEVVSRTIKGMYAGSNVKQLGGIHLFITRLLALYRESRDSDHVKPTVATVLAHYYRHLPVAVLYEDYPRQRKCAEYGQVEAAVRDLRCGPGVVQELYTHFLLLRSVFEGDWVLLNQADGNVLAERFFESETLLNPEQYAQGYAPAFGRLLESLRQETSGRDVTHG